jgi:hypothetical protein
VSLQTLLTNTLLYVEETSRKVSIIFKSVSLTLRTFLAKTPEHLNEPSYHPRLVWMEAMVGHREGHTVPTELALTLVCTGSSTGLSA